MEDRPLEGRLEAPTRPGAGGAAEVESPFGRGDAIDRFTVLERLGAGGMGLVLSAYDCTLDRKVAIKVLRPDRASARLEDDRVRLLREAQAMARLRHPNVITVHEVGTVDDHVFIAMELVEGQTLAGWLESEPRTWREIVRTFAQAGSGLVAAHRAGLVHRDFKPDNVLVGLDGEVRVTDFGLAGLSAGPDAAASPTMLAAPLTRTGTVMGTPAYMSPEQHAGDQADARSDQFSFCVALYEALYGVHPFAAESAPEMLFAITERRISPPRAEAPRRLRSAILRGLEPRPDDRWPSMEALLHELSRDPASARRWWLLAGGAAAAAVLAGVLFTRSGPELCQGAAPAAAATWNAAARQRLRSAFAATGSPTAADVFARVDRLLTERLDGWASAHTEACRATRMRGEQSEAMLDLRMQCLERARREVASLIDLWGRDGVKIDSAVDAARRVGDTTPCGDTEALAMPVAPPRDPETAKRIDEVRTRLDAVAAYRKAGQLAAGTTLAREVTAAARKLDYPPVLAEALHQNGVLETGSGKADEGVSLLYEALQASASAHDDVRHAAIATELLGDLVTAGDRLDEAQTVASFAEAAVGRAGNREELVARLLDAQGMLLFKRARYEEALDRWRRARPIYERRLGRSDPSVIRLVHYIAVGVYQLGRLDEALALHRENLAIAERALGPVHPRIGTTLDHASTVLARKGEMDQAIAFAARALAIREKIYPPVHPMIAASLDTLAGLRASQGRLDEALALFERAESILVATQGPDHPDTVNTRDDLAQLAVERGDTAKARRLIKSVIAAKTRIHGPDHPRVGHAWKTLGLALLREQQWKPAEAAFARAVAIQRKPGGDPQRLMLSLLGLAEALTGQRQHARAISLLEEATGIDERVRGPKSPYRASILAALGEAHLGTGRVALALRTLTRAVAIAETIPGEAASLPMMRFQLARALWANRKHARAVALARSAHAALTDPARRRDRDRVARWLRAHR